MGLPPSRDDVVTSHENLNDHGSWLTCVNAEIRRRETTSGRSRGERQHLVETRNEALGKHVVVGNRAGVHVDA